MPRNSTTSQNFFVVGTQDGVKIFGTTDQLIDYDTKHTITSSDVERHDDAMEGVYTIHNALTKRECQQFVTVTESMGYDEALITTGRGMVRMTELRNNKRVMWQTRDEDFSAVMWPRVAPHVPETFTDRGGNTWDRSGLNERLRFYRYNGGERFNKHFDGCFPRNHSERSYLTIIIYLTDNFTGGQTTFFEDRGFYSDADPPTALQIQPEQGAALLFWHGQHDNSPLHEGSEVTRGTKYVLRSDIMYTRRQRSSQS